MDVQKVDKRERGTLQTQLKTVQQDASKNTKNISNKRCTFRETVQYFTKKCTIDKKDSKYLKPLKLDVLRAVRKTEFHEPHT